MQKRILFGIIIVVLVTILATAGIFAYSKFFASRQKTAQTAGPALSGVEGWKTYTNSNYGITLKYPALNSFISLSNPEAIQGSSDINSGCYVGNENGKYKNKAAPEFQFLINGVQFCLSTATDTTLGHSGYVTYFYTTPHKNAEYLTLAFTFYLTNCPDLKGGPNYQACLNYIRNPENNQDRILGNIISTFKFTK